MSDEEDVIIEDEDQMALDLLGPTMAMDDLKDAYREYTNGGEVGDEQVLGLMQGATEEFYHQNHSAIDMDEVLKLTHKVEYRTKKLNKMSKLLDKKNPCPNEIAAMGDFLKEVEVFTDEVRAEAKCHQEEVEELRTLKRGLLLQLQTRQSLVAGLGNSDNDPTSVNSLLAHGDYSHYEWKLGSRFSDDLPPEPTDPNTGGGVGPDGLEDEYDFGGALSMGQSRQPRYAIDDDENEDDEMQLEI